MIKEDGMGAGAAPTNSVGGGNVAGAGVPLAGKPANWGEPGVSKKAQRKRQKAVVYKEECSPVMMPMMTRRAPNFAGAAVFEVAPAVFYSAKMEKRKGKHWKTYLEEDDCLSEVRDYANKNPGKPIILKNERTGEMCYARYGKK